MNKKDLDILPESINIPERSTVVRRLNNVISIGRSDYRYIEDRHFCGRFAITNRRGCGYTHAERIAKITAAAKEDGVKPTICLAQRDGSGTKINTASPDGATWRTVELLSAFKTSDDKLVVIEIAQPKAKGKE